MIHRYPQLDALRGLAATGVMVNHATMIYGSVAHPAGWAGKLIDVGFRIGNPLVVLFFVLSGFVLTLRPPGPYPRYLARRIGRIYPAVLVTIAMIVIVNRIAPVSPAAWMGGFLGEALPRTNDAGQVARAATLIGPVFANIRFDTPLWSLFHEMWFSLLLPPLIALLLFSRAAFALAIAGGYAVSSVLLVRAGAYVPSQLFELRWMNALLFLTYLPCFGVGMAAADAVTRRGRAPAVPRWAEWLVLIAFLFALDGKLPLLGVAAASLGLLLCAIAAPITAGLTSMRAARFLGRISFSVYLVHLPIIALMVVGTRGIMPLAAALLVGAAASIGAATVLERLVERPAMNLTRRWLARSGSARTFATV